MARILEVRASGADPPLAEADAAKETDTLTRPAPDHHPATTPAVSGALVRGAGGCATTWGPDSKAVTTWR